jgi:hypothetical protein
LFKQLNTGRTERFEEERKTLKALPERRLESYKRVGPMRVSSGSLIRVHNNSYSVHSRLIGERVSVRLYADHLEVWYAQRQVEAIPRLRGQNKHRVQYRHVIDSLVKKPGAFENYRYRQDMFPTSRFRRAYDELKTRHTLRVAAKEYLKILHLAATVSEERVDQALFALERTDQAVVSEVVRRLVAQEGEIDRPGEIHIAEVSSQPYDELLELAYV